MSSCSLSMFVLGSESASVLDIQDLNFTLSPLESVELE